MPRLAKYMLAGQGLIICNRKAKPRFFIIVGILLILIILGISISILDYAQIWDKLREIVDKPLVTSPYWKAVFCE